jgi:hypothetical protein
VGGRNSGRPQKPAALRTLHGSRHRPRHGEEPQIPTEPVDDERDEPKVIAAPAGLTVPERRYWGYFAPLLASARVLTPADVQTLKDYVLACVQVDEQSKRLRRAWNAKRFDQGLVRMLDASLRGWIERKTKLAGELALTAISRTRVAWTGHHQRPSTVPTPRKPQSKLAQLQEQAAALRRPVKVK